MKITTIGRKDLSRLRHLTTLLSSNDALIVTKRGIPDAVILPTHTLLETDDLAPLIAWVQRLLDRTHPLVLTPPRLTILRAVQNLGSARLKSIAGSLDKPPTSIYPELQRLANAGHISTHTRTTATFYSLSPKAARVLAAIEETSGETSTDTPTEA